MRVGSIGVQGYPGVSNPEILLRKYAQYVLNLEIPRYSHIAAVHTPEILRVHDAPAVISLEKSFYFTRYWEHPCMLVVFLFLAAESLLVVYVHVLVVDYRTTS